MIYEHHDHEFFIAPWGNTLVLTGLVASMVVNALVTGLIVFKILKVFLEVRASTSAVGERTWGSLALSSTGGPKLQHIIFIIIESGMALFAIQLVRVMIISLNQVQVGPTPPSLEIALDSVVIIHQTLNVCSFFFFYFFCFTDDDNNLLPGLLHTRALHPL